MMLEDCSVQKIYLSVPEEKHMLKTFLCEASLGYEEDIDTAYGIFDEYGTICGCGCAAGGVLKCFAVAESLRGQNALGKLTSTLLADRFANGITDLFVFTKCKNESVFHAAGFHTVVRSSSVVLLENTKNGPERAFKQFYEDGDQDRVVGAVVVNCNPFTLGHRALLAYAASQCDVLHVFVLEEDRSDFSTEDRLKMVLAGTADLKNVRVHLGNRYMISAATFPHYFLKKNDDVTTIQAEIDVRLFAQRIAPLLNIRIRFAGEEPFDGATAQYNETMQKLLPEFGIEFREIPRFCVQGEAVSASKVRSYLKEDPTGRRAAPYLPLTTQQYLHERQSNKGERQI